jgi:hypothetical protein
MESVLPRMSLIDFLTEIHQSTPEKIKSTSENDKKSTREQLGLNLSPTDITYILRITSLILRRGGISTVLNNNIYNMYEARPDLLPESILDRSSNEAGQYLIRKFVSLNKLFSFDKTDAPNVNEISGPKTLVQKVKQAKGVTVRRIPTKKQQTAKTEREVEEGKRIKEVAKQTKQIDRISSHMNLCQAIVKPDCSKPKVQKAQGIQKALVQLLIQSYATNTGDTVLDEESGKVQLENEETVILGSSTIP